MEKMKNFADELEVLCLKHNLRIEHRTDYDFDSEINEYTYIEHKIAIVDVEQSFSYSFDKVINLPIGQPDTD